MVKELCENAVDAGATRVDVVIDGAGTVRIRVDRRRRRHRRRPAAPGAGPPRHVEDPRRRRPRGGGDAGLSRRGAGEHRRRRRRDMWSRPAARARRRAPAGAPRRDGGGGDAGAARPAPPSRCSTSSRPRPPACASSAASAPRRPPRSRWSATSRSSTPSCASRCVVDGRTRLRSPGGALDDALRAVFGAEAAELLPVAAEGDINVGGAISEPRRHRSNRSGLVIVVNGRRVHNRSLLAAVAEAYRGLVPAGRYPFGVVSVELDPLEVDVNVHPTKREVRFRDERQVFAAVQRACWQALQGASVYRVAGFDDGRASSSRDGPRDGRGSTDRVAAAGATWPPRRSRRMELEGGAPSGAARTSLQSLRPLRALGQQGGRWLLAASSAGVVVVDPHAAHEKVIYTELLARLVVGRRRRGSCCSSRRWWSATRGAWSCSPPTPRWWRRAGSPSSPSGRRRCAAPRCRPARPRPTPRGWSASCSTRSAPADRSPSSATAPPRWSPATRRCGSATSSPPSSSSACSTGSSRPAAGVTCPHGRPALADLRRRDAAAHLPTPSGMTRGRRSPPWRSVARPPPARRCSPSSSPAAPAPSSSTPTPARSSAGWWSAPRDRPPPSCAGCRCHLLDLCEPGEPFTRRGLAAPRPRRPRRARRARRPGHRRRRHRPVPARPARGMGLRRRRTAPPSCGPS